MPKLRKPIRVDIFGTYAKYVQLKYMTKGQAKRKLRNAGCGPLEVGFYEIIQKDSRDVYGRAYLIPDRGWVVHITKK